MKAILKIWTFLCVGFILWGCCNNPITPEFPENEDENPVIDHPYKPLIEGSLFNIKIIDDIMATVGNGTWNAIAYGNGKYVAVGGDSIYRGEALVSTYGQIAYSTDGISWTNEDFSNIIWYTIVYANGKFIVGGIYHIAEAADVHVYKPYIAYSTDGISWTTKDISSDILSNITGIKSIAYGNGVYLGICTTTGRLLEDISVMISSTDGINWTDATTINRSNDIAFGNGVFVTVGKVRYQGSDMGAISYSTDNGESWTEVENGNTAWSRVAYGNGRFVAIESEQGNITYSTDGKSWNSVSKKILSSTDIAFGKGLFVLTTLTEVYYSFDGIEWNRNRFFGATSFLESICVME